MTSKKQLAIFGSTGSIGTQTLDIAAQYPDIFDVKVLIAGNNWELLAQQALRFKPDYAVIGNEKFYNSLSNALKDTHINVMGGIENINTIASEADYDIAVASMVGYSGLLPTVNAIKASKTIALANKETLVVAGSYIMPLATEYKSTILPVDSEHSAIFQCLIGEDKQKIRNIYLTASGGPFRKHSIEELEKVTVEDALSHPNWNMGAKVTIDSATMMNKGFEMIEAKWLFNCNPDKIKVVVHPQSIVHSMVEYVDGSIKAQLGIPDMHLPIRYALGFPERLSTDKGFLDLYKTTSLTFEEPDLNKFRLLSLAYQAANEGGTAPCVMNAANEVAVRAFLNRKIKFTDITKVVEEVTNFIPVKHNPSLDDFIEYNTKGVEKAENLLNKF